MSCISWMWILRCSTCCLLYDTVLSWHGSCPCGLNGLEFLVVIGSLFFLQGWKFILDSNRWKHTYNQLILHLRTSDFLASGVKWKWPLNKYFQHWGKSRSSTFWFIQSLVFEGPCIDNPENIRNTVQCRAGHFRHGWLRSKRIVMLHKSSVAENRHVCHALI